MWSWKELWVFKKIDLGKGLFLVSKCDETVIKHRAGKGQALLEHHKVRITTSQEIN